MNRYRGIVGRINYGLFLTIVALLPFPQIFLRYACVLWFVSWLLEGRWFSRPQSLRENRVAIPFVLFGVWFAWRVISGLWAPDLDAWRWQISRYILFAAIVPVGLWGVNAHYNWRTAGKVLVAGCVAAVPFYITVMTVFYYHRDLIELFQWSGVWNTGNIGWCTFFETNISWIKHRLFLCSVELLGVVLACQLWHRRLAVLLPVLLVMLSAILLTGSRQSILTLAGLMAVALVYELPRRYRIRYGVGILLLGIIIGFGVLRMHPRMQNFDYTDFAEMREIKADHNARLNIWAVALQEPSDYIAHGLGAGQSTQYMIRKYNEANLSYYANKQFHPHNQYLEELMELGIPGLLFFLLCWLSIPICASRKGAQTALLLTTIFVMNMLTDCMFGKFCGIALWAAGLLLILLQSDPQCQE